MRMLLARRLVEAGVRFVTLTYGSWDHHDNIDANMRRNTPAFDQGFATLIRDLDRRGLLGSTLVCVGTEFGRTPKINPTAGRDHWPQCYFSIWAGCGVRGGAVIGDSDKTGSAPLTEPVTPAMVGATMMEMSGVDAQARAEFRVLPDTRVIHELF